MTVIYELRRPGSDGYISRHRLRRTAEKALDREHRRFRPDPNVGWSTAPYIVELER